MKPIFKYSGGKSRELKRIVPLLPKEYNRVVEPMAGGAGVFFALEKPGLLGDIRTNNMSVYRVVRSEDSYKELQEFVDELKTKDVEELKDIFYYHRDDMYPPTNDMDMAKRWIVIRQLVFSGIDRINKSGKFNAPFGWYKKFNCNLSIDHHNLLKETELWEGDFASCIGETGDFLFLDPPYLERNSTYGGSGDDQDFLFHKRIADYANNSKAHVMMIHTDCEEYRELYKGWNFQTADFQYSQNFKGRDNSKQKVQHLYITNY